MRLKFIEVYPYDGIGLPMLINVQAIENVQVKEVWEVSDPNKPTDVKRHIDCRCLIFFRNGDDPLEVNQSYTDIYHQIKEL